MQDDSSINNISTIKNEIIDKNDDNDEDFQNNTSPLFYSDQISIFYVIHVEKRH